MSEPLFISDIRVRASRVEIPPVHLSGLEQIVRKRKGTENDSFGKIKEAYLEETTSFFSAIFEYFENLKQYRQGALTRFQKEEGNLFRRGLAMLKPVELSIVSMQIHDKYPSAFNLTREEKLVLGAVFHESLKKTQTEYMPRHGPVVFEIEVTSPDYWLYAVDKKETCIRYQNNRPNSYRLEDWPTILPADFATASLDGKIIEQIAKQLYRFVPRTKDNSQRMYIDFTSISYSLFESDGDNKDSQKPDTANRGVTKNQYRTELITYEHFEKCINLFFDATKVVAARAFKIVGYRPNYMLITSTTEIAEEIRARWETRIKHAAEPEEGYICTTITQQQFDTIAAQYSEGTGSMTMALSPAFTSVLNLPNSKRNYETFKGFKGNLKEFIEYDFSSEKPHETNPLLLSLKKRAKNVMYCMFEFNGRSEDIPSIVEKINDMELALEGMYILRPYRVKTIYMYVTGNLGPSVCAFYQPTQFTQNRKGPNLHVICK